MGPRIAERANPEWLAWAISRFQTGSSWRRSIAKPDLVERLRTGAPLAEIDWATAYASGPKGYSDYPALQPAAA